MFRRFQAGLFFFAAFFCSLTSLASSEHFIAEKPRIYIFSALPTDQTDPSDQGQSVQIVFSEINSVLASGEAMVPDKIYAFRWGVIRSELISIRDKLDQYQSMTPLSIKGLFYLEPHRFGVINDSIKTLKKLSSAIEEAKNLRRGPLAVPIERDPAFMELQSHVMTLYTKLQYLQNLNKSYLMHGMQREAMGTDDGPQGTLMKKLEERTNWLRPWFNVIVIREARQAQLIDALERPETVGIVWISHATNRTNSFVGGKIADADGVDITPTLSLARSNLRYLGIVGCKAKEMIDNLTNKGAFLKSEKLIVDSHEDTVVLGGSAMNAIYRMVWKLNTEFPGVMPIRDLKHFYKTTTTSPTQVDIATTRRIHCPEKLQKGLRLKIEASVASEVLLQLEEKAVAHISTKNPLIVDLPLNDSTHQNDLVFLAVGENMPELTIKTLDGSLEWKLRRFANGEPVGATIQVYEPFGNLGELVELVPAECR